MYSYLSMRKHVSDWVTTYRPLYSPGQGVGIALFFIYINDMKNSIEHCEVMLFADDTMLCFVGTNFEEMLDNNNLT